jgi:hypothetical protein
MSRTDEAIARAEAEGALPQSNRESLEDECTRILSERLNDRAPLYEESYRPHARRLIEVITAADRAACAEAVRAAGCTCKQLWLASQERPSVFGFEGQFEGTRAYTNFDRLAEHDHRCPEALAAAIEARGRE